MAKKYLVTRKVGFVVCEVSFVVWGFFNGIDDFRFEHKIN